MLGMRSGLEATADERRCSKTRGCGSRRRICASGMKLGLGTGSTARHFVELLGERVRAGLDIVGVPTSEATSADAERFGVPQTTLDESPQLDLTVDGADEIGPDLALIKGGGERCCAKRSWRRLSAHDRHRRRDEMGRCLAVSAADRGPPFGLAPPGGRSRPHCRGATGKLALRRGKDGHAFVTDGGHWIIDAALGRLQNRKHWLKSLRQSPGSWNTDCLSALRTRPFLPGRTAFGSSSGLELCPPKE